MCSYPKIIKNTKKDDSFEALLAKVKAELNHNNSSKSSLSSSSSSRRNKT